MGNRQKIPWIVTLAAALAFAREVPAMAQAPTVQRANLVAPAQAEAEVTVTWVFRAEDLFACRTVAYDLRQVLAEHGARVAIHAVAVDADPELVASFLRKERLDIPVSRHTEVQYRQAYGTAPSPALYVARRGHVVQSLFASQSSGTWQEGEVQLYEYVGALLARRQVTNRVN